jgi:hypothetical protein
MSPSREVKCQSPSCSWKGARYYGAAGLLTKLCPSCGSRTTYAKYYPGDQAVTVEPSLATVPVAA